MVAALILKSAYDTFRRAAWDLLDRAKDPELPTKIASALRSQMPDLNVERVLALPAKRVEVEIHLPDDATVDRLAALELEAQRAIDTVLGAKRWRITLRPLPPSSHGHVH